MKFLAWIAALLSMTFASPALGQATRTWVSGVGDDANPCSRTAPCKTFAGAISKTAAGGEISVLDPGGFGAVTITKSITIDGAGTHASILAVNTNGVVVNGANIVVNLRNLSINGAGGTVGNGIRILNAAAVNLENVAIMNFAGNTANGRGIAIETSTSNVRVSIANSTIYNVNNHGIHAIPGGGNVLLSVVDTDVVRGGASAIQLRSSTNAVIDRSTLAHNRLGAGITLETSTASAGIGYSLLAHNAFGVNNPAGSGTASAFIYGNVITANTTAGLQIAGGSITSLGNNMIRGNSGNEAPTSTIGTQ